LLLATNSNQNFIIRKVQIDFHYCTIRVIAEKTGFSAEDSQIISYASQHVDDAVDHEKMNIDGHLDILSRRFSDKTFDPICTAHKGLQLLQDFQEAVQNKIYIPFHFLPELEISSDLKVVQNCSLSKKLVRQALAELSKSTGEQRVMNLVRLGITLHTYADSWSHQHFSGRHSSLDNDIRDIETCNHDAWKKIPLLSQIEYNSLPDIGHAEAASFPDQSHLKWRYVKESDGKTYERDNPQLFIDAAEHIFDILKGIKHENIWKEIKTKLIECFSFEAETLDEKFQKFQRIFPEIGFYYDEKQWRNEALNVVERSKLFKQIKKEYKSFTLGSDKKWFFFHLAALEQREHIQKLLEKR
jgi:hypothetical protein